MPSDVESFGTAFYGMMLTTFGLVSSVILLIINIASITVLSMEHAWFNGAAIATWLSVNTLFSLVAICLFSIVIIHSYSCNTDTNKRYADLIAGISTMVGLFFFGKIAFVISGACVIGVHFVRWNPVTNMALAVVVMQLCVFGLFIIKIAINWCK